MSPGLRLLVLWAVQGCAASPFELSQEANLTAFKLLGTMEDQVRTAHLLVVVNPMADSLVLTSLNAHLRMLIANGTDPNLLHLLEGTTIPLQQELQDTLLLLQAQPGTNRTTRQLVVAAATGAALLSGALGVWNSAQTTSIKAALNDETAKRNNMMLTVTDALKTDQDIVHALKVLKKAVKAGLKDLTRVERLEHTIAAVNTVTTRVQQRLRALQALLALRLPTNLIPVAKLKESWTKLQTLAANRRYKLLDSDYTSLFRSPLALLSNGTTVTVLIPVAVNTMNSENSWQLFSHLHLPLQFNNQSWMIHSEDKLLAVNPDRSLFQILDHNLLHDCTKVNTGWRCPNSRPRLRSGKSTCLTALFQRRSNQVHKACPMSPILPTDAVYQLNQTSFIVIHPQPVLYTVTCPTQASIVSLQGTSLLHLNHSCTATSDLYQLSTGDNHLPPPHLEINVGTLDEWKPEWTKSSVQTQMNRAAMISELDNLKTSVRNEFRNRFSTTDTTCQPSCLLSAALAGLLTAGLLHLALLLLPKLLTRLRLRKGRHTPRSSTPTSLPELIRSPARSPSWDQSEAHTPIAKRPRYMDEHPSPALNMLSRSQYDGVRIDAIRQFKDKLEIIFQEEQDGARTLHARYPDSPRMFSWKEAMSKAFHHWLDDQGEDGLKYAKRLQDISRNLAEDVVARTNAEINNQEHSINQSLAAHARDIHPGNIKKEERNFNVYEDNLVERQLPTVAEDTTEDKPSSKPVLHLAP